MKTYFAHSINDYHSLFEMECRHKIEKEFGRVICPNRDLPNFAYLKNRQMGPYLAVVASCTALVFLPQTADKYISKGVYMEIQKAVKNKIPVYMMNRVTRHIRLLDPVNLRVTNSDSWSFKYAKVETPTAR